MKLNVTLISVNRWMLNQYVWMVECYTNFCEWVNVKPCVNRLRMYFCCLWCFSTSLFLTCSFCKKSPNMVRELISFSFQVNQSFIIFKRFRHFQQFSIFLQWSGWGVIRSNPIEKARLEIYFSKINKRIKFQFYFTSWNKNLQSISQPLLLDSFML